MSRLKIGKAGNYLDLKADTSIQIDANSPLWFGDRTGDILPSVKVYSFAIPSTPHNRIILKRPELLDNAEDFLAEDDWLIFFDDKLIERGRLEVEDAPNENQDYKVTFIGGIAGKLYQLKEDDISKTLQDYRVPVLGTDTASVLQGAATPQSDYVFPTVRIADEGTFDENDVPTNYKFLNWYFQGAYHRRKNTGIEDVSSTLAPMLRVRKVLDKLLEKVGYALRGIFDSSEHHVELNELILFNNVTMDKIITESAKVDFEGVGYKGSFNLSDYLPKLKGSDLLRATADTFACAIITSVHERVIKLLPYIQSLRGKVVDWTAKADPRHLKERKLEGLPFQFSYNHISEEYGDQRALSLNGRTVDYHFTTYDEIQALTADDIGKIIYVESINEYLVLIRQGGAARSAVARRVGKNLGIINQDSEEGFQPASDTLHMVSDIEDGDVFGNEKLLWCPAYYNEVVTPLNEGADKIDKPVFLFYRGLQIRDRYSSDSVSNPVTETYPLANSNNYNERQERIGELSLVWTGEDGLYEKWWKEWHEALKRMRPVSRAIRMTATDLEQLDWMARIRIDDHLYLVKRIQITLTTQQILPASVELMQIL